MAALYVPLDLMSEPSQSGMLDSNVLVNSVSKQNENMLIQMGASVKPNTCHYIVGQHDSIWLGLQAKQKP